MNPTYQYKAECLRVVDGDTIDLRVDLGMKIEHRVRVRLQGINTPETYGVKKDSEEYKLGLAAKERLIELIMGKSLTVVTEKDKTGKYGRYIATIYVDEVDVNDTLVKEGHAKEVTY